MVVFISDGILFYFIIKKYKMTLYTSDIILSLKNGKKNHLIFSMYYHDLW
jgi:hypothetical protein